MAKPALEALTAALALGGELNVGLVGAQTGAAANQIAELRARRASWRSPARLSRQPRYATDAAAAEALCRASGAAVVIAPATSRWSRALPGVAFRLAAASIPTPPHLAVAERRSGGDPLVLPAAHGSRADARADARGSCCWTSGCLPAWSGAAECAAAVETVAVDRRRPAPR